MPTLPPLQYGTGLPWGLLCKTRGTGAGRRQPLPSPAGAHPILPQPVPGLAAWEDQLPSAPWSVPQGWCLGRQGAHQLPLAISSCSPEAWPRCRPPAPRALPLVLLRSGRCSQACWEEGGTLGGWRARNPSPAAFSRGPKGDVGKRTRFCPFASGLWFGLTWRTAPQRGSGHTFQGGLSLGHSGPPSLASSEGGSSGVGCRGGAGHCCGPMGARSATDTEGPWGPTPPCYPGLLVLPPLQVASPASGSLSVTVSLKSFLGPIPHPRVCPDRILSGSRGLSHLSDTGAGFKQC